MPDASIGLGDFPAWLALAVSIGSALRQHFVNNQARIDRHEFEVKSLSERKSFQKKLRIEELAKDIEELRAVALDYWTKPETEAGSAGLIINIKIKDLSSRIWSYNNFLWKDVASDFFKIKIQVTGGGFQSSSRPASAHNSQLIRDFLDSFSNFRENLRKECDKIDIS